MQTDSINKFASINNDNVQPPERPARWTEPFVADSLGNACIQDEAGLVWVTHPLFVRYSENCLNINVYAPNVSQKVSTVTGQFNGLLAFDILCSLCSCYYL